MEPEDCAWCGSAGSTEYEVCQVCLVRLPEDGPRDRIVVAIEPSEIVVEEGSSPEREAATGE